MHRANGYRWEKWLPKEGKRFNRAINYLITNGIITEGEAFNGFVESVIKLITESTYVLTVPTHY